ncbi:MAG: peptidase [Geminicoccaceae bacterium]|nr:peptidase [Geminicoccaceae bacterium]
MTYCIGLDLAEGFVMLADTRTNAGVDNVSTVSKLHVFENEGERLIVAMTAGNLAVSQSVMSLLAEGEDPDDVTLYTVPSMFKAAELVGAAIRKVFKRDGEALKAQGVPFDVSILLGGQIADRRMRMFLVYSAGNFIETTEDTPFLQIGEHKYGKPILDRAAKYETTLGDGVKLALISMDSTLRSNMTVGLPIDLLVYRRDTLRVALRRRIDFDDLYFQNIRELWSEALRNAYRSIPDPTWEDYRAL